MKILGIKSCRTC